MPIHIIFLCAPASYSECLSVRMLKLGDCRPLPVPAAEVLNEKDVLSSNHKAAGGGGEALAMTGTPELC